MAKSTPEGEKKQILDMVYRRALDELFEAVDKASASEPTSKGYYDSLIKRSNRDDHGFVDFNPPADACYVLDGEIAPTSVLVKALHQRVNVLAIEAQTAVDTLSNGDSDLLVMAIRYLDEVIDARGLRKRNLIKIVKTPEKGGCFEEDKVDELPIPFTNLIETDYGVLYDRLVSKGYLADTGKPGFIYYFTGEGEQPAEKLKWKTDAILLSVLMRKLNNGRVPWKKLAAIFEGLNVDSMKINLSDTKNNSKVAYARHEQIIDRLVP